MFNAALTMTAFLGNLTYDSKACPHLALAMVSFCSLGESSEASLTIAQLRETDKAMRRLSFVIGCLRTSLTVRSNLVSYREQMAIDADVELPLPQRCCDVWFPEKRSRHHWVCTLRRNDLPRIYYE